MLSIIHSIYCKKEVLYTKQKHKFNCNIRGNEIAQTVLQHHRKIIFHMLLKNKLNQSRIKMNSSNNNIYKLKCYLKFFTIVPVEMGSN